jgi:serine/threonine protein kinase
MLRSNKLTSQSAVRDLEFEMHLMARITHKHILRCIGTSLASVPAERKFLALQMLQTTLADALPPPPLPDGTSTIQRISAMRRWPLKRSLQLGLELSLALRHLHDEAFTTYRLLHRDVKPKNLGLMNDGRLVLFDFGISKLVRRAPAGGAGHEETVAIPMTGVCGSLRYMAPEVAMTKPYNHRSELYSFGIVLWEMCMLRRPYDTMLAESFERRVCIEGERPKLDEKKLTPALCSLLSQCWDADFNRRPEARELADQMMTLVASNGCRGV